MVYEDALKVYTGKNEDYTLIDYLEKTCQKSRTATWVKSDYTNNTAQNEIICPHTR